MIVVFVLIALVVVGAVAVLIARDRPLIEEDPVDARALRWPPAEQVSAADLAQVRFTVAVRGYRMDEVDRVLDDTRAALAERDHRIAELLSEVKQASARSSERGPR